MKVKFGLKNAKYAKITYVDGAETYGTPVAIPGAVSLTLKAKGDSTEFHADDNLYFSSSANQGYDGDVEFAELITAFKKDILGQTEDSNGALTENKDADFADFALGFEIQGDEKGRRTWLYRCTPTRPDQDHKTQEGKKEPVTDKFAIKVSPRLKDGNVKTALTLSDTNETAYNSFFGAVYEPVAGA